jgi:two-component system, OmpR family, phosphate regulon response regulator PhoB
VYRRAAQGSGAGEAPRGGTRRVLVVEDDPAVRELLLSVVREEPGVVAWGVAGGAQALKTLRTLTPDLILLDLVMPGMDGFELAGRVRAMPGMADVRLVVVTALGPLREARRRALAAGCDAVLGKPFELDELLGTLRGCLAPRGARTG